MWFVVPDFHMLLHAAGLGFVACLKMCRKDHNAFHGILIITKYIKLLIAGSPVNVVDDVLARF